MTALSAGFRGSMRAIAASTNSMGFTCLRCTRSACAVPLRSASSTERDIDSFLCWRGQTEFRRSRADRPEGGDGCARRILENSDALAKDDPSVSNSPN
jgi:hypothetical protein